MSKRNNKKKRNKKHVYTKRKLKYYPTIFCTEENICIAISQKEMKFRADRFGRISPRDKIGIKHWKNSVARYRSEEYEIDFNNKIHGDLVFCPKCGSLADFRLFPSSTVPEFREVVNDKEDSS